MKRSPTFSPEELEELRRIDEQIDAEFEASPWDVQERQFSAELDEAAKQQAMDNRSLAKHLTRKRYRRNYYQANKERLKEKHRAYYKENREKISEQGKKYRAAKAAEISAKKKAYRADKKDHIARKNREYRESHREEMKAARREHYRKNPEQYKSRQERYRQAHIEERRMSEARYREANKEKIRARQKKWIQGNREKVSQYKKSYYNANRKKHRDTVQRCRERRKMGISTIKTNSHEEWLALRKKYIGGSDAAAVVNMNPFSSPFALWAEKTGKVPAFEGNLATEVGAFLEEFIAKKFAAETGKQVRRRRVSFVNSNYPWAIANIDRDIVGEDAGLEIKFTDTLNTKKFKNGEYPDNFYVQCVHYLAVTGKKRWYLAVLVGNREFHIYTIARDEDEIRALMAAEEAFWNNYVLKDTPPPTDGTKATTETISGLYAEAENDNIIDLCSVREVLDEYMEITQQIEALKKLKEAKANEIKALMGNSSKGTGGNYKVSWNNASRSTFDAKRFAEENPTIDLRPYYKLSSYRTFKVTEAGR